MVLKRHRHHQRLRRSTQALLRASRRCTPRPGTHRTCTLLSLSCRLPRMVVMRPRKLNSPPPPLPFLAAAAAAPATACWALRANLACSSCNTGGCHELEALHDCIRPAAGTQQVQQAGAKRPCCPPPSQGCSGCIPVVEPALQSPAPQARQAPTCSQSASAAATRCRLAASSAAATSASYAATAPSW